MTAHQAVAMRRLRDPVFLIIVAGAFTACGPSTLEVGAIRSLSPGLPSEGGCLPQPGELTKGSVDISVSRNYVVFAELLGGNDRHFVAQELILSYTAPNMVFETERLPIHAVPFDNPNCGGSGIAVELLSMKAWQRLQERVTPADQTTLLVTFSIAGVVGSATVRSEQVKFPIQVFASGFSCGPGQFIAPTGPCGGRGGQDGAPVSCRDGGT